MSRAAEESSGGVLSFTFLDVLTCTMGSLVLLLVVLGERAKRTAYADVLAEQATVAAEAPLADAGPPDADAPLTSEEAARQLAAVRAKQAELEQLRADAVQKLRDEQARVAHLEDHERRLEHELAKLHFTLERLDEAEKNLQVDQQAAEKNLERLTGLVQTAKKQLEEAQKTPQKQRSFAIVPYKGANGTYRRPIYIECTREAVVIQPEGIKLTAADFDGPLRSGNPLAAAVRAAREELNARSGAAAGSDPYPLLVVRPDGAAAYGAALSAIAAYDADYGYEFVDADWNLEFPPTDPILGQVMTHAVDQARQRQALLAKAAPRRYATRLKSGNGGGGDGGDGSGGAGDGEGGDFDVLAGGSGSGGRIGERSGDGHLGGGASGGQVAGSDRYGKSTGGARGDFADQFAATGGASGGPQGTTGGSADGAQADGGSPGGGQSNGQPGGQPGVAGSPNGVAAQGQPGGPANAFATAGSGFSASSSPSGVGAPAPPDVHAPQTNASTVASAAGSSSGAPSSGSSERGSAAESRGVNWANAAASQKASAIARPIKVIVGPNEMALLPDGATSAADATVVSFRQPTGKVLDQLAVAVQTEIKGWGLAGQAMYWRPTLVMEIAPGADRQAARLAELLQDSGIDVRMPQTAAAPAAGGVYAR